MRPRDSSCSMQTGTPREGRVCNWQGMTKGRQDAQVSFQLQILVTFGLLGFRLSGP